MTLTLPSFAKINWVLEILGKRTDGYHELRTLLQTISLADELSFTASSQGIEIVSTHHDLPCDETNLAHRAAKLLSDFTGVERGVRIMINKRIPVAGGLGGGSSNAAVTLLALQKLWNVELATRDLLTIGAKLGADVPFFFMGGTCLGIGRGDEVYPLEDFAAPFLLLVSAGIPLSTAQVYADLPAELTNPAATAKMPLSLDAAYANTRSRHPVSGQLSGQVPGQILGSMKPGCFKLHNDLEIPAFARHPMISEIKRRLMDIGARSVLMSGSGSTVFAIFDSEEARERALSDLGGTGWWCAPAHTLSRRQYQEALSVMDNG
jgi:4-diphosphocytidyl-2-C-methyl-D-erythritol kinase